jgi:hypothetical protein
MLLNNAKCFAAGSHDLNGHILPSVISHKPHSITFILHDLVILHLEDEVAYTGRVSVPPFHSSLLTVPNSYRNQTFIGQTSP